MQFFALFRGLSYVEVPRRTVQATSNPFKKGLGGSGFGVWVLGLKSQAVRLIADCSPAFAFAGIEFDGADLQPASEAIGMTEYGKIGESNM